MEEMSKLVVLLADGFETIEALIPVDICRRGKVEVTLVSTTGNKEVISAQNVVVTADALLADVEDEAIDAVYIPGGTKGAESLRDNPEVIAYIQKAHKNKKWVAAICAGPIVLDKAGLLKGTHFTAFPTIENQITDNERHSEQTIVIDNGILTSRGPVPALPFGYQLLAELADEETAKKVYQDMQGPMVFTLDLFD